MPKQKSNEFQSDDPRPEWLDDSDDSSGEINSLIQGAEDSNQASADAGAAPTITEDTGAVEALAQWSSGYDDPRAELDDLEGQRARMKRLPKAQLSPGEFAAIKNRIAALKKQLGLD